MKYLVMECRSAYAVVLGDDGAFLKVANMRYEVGQTVTDVVPLNLPEITEQPKTNHKRWISPFMAAAACLVLVITSIFFTGQMPYASVYMTINPEVRIDVSRSDVVVGVAGMNEDGAQLLNGYDHKKKDLDTVMDELVDRAIDMGYLHEGGKITLSLDGSEEWIVSHETHLNQHLNEHLTDKITVIIDVEQKQPEQTAPMAPTGTIVIPVGPDSYGDSDYGEDGESDYAPAGTPESGYGQSDDEDSDYSAPENDGQTDYGDTDYTEPEDDGQTDYEEAESDYGNDSDDEESDYGYIGAEDPDDKESNDNEDEAQSDYDDLDDDYTSVDESDSGYHEPENNGETDYDDRTEDDGESEYADQPDDSDEEDNEHSTEADDGEDASSDYEESDSEYEESDYGEE